MNILFAASEFSPLAATGGLGDVVAALPKALNKLGHDCRVILPLYGKIKREFGDKLNFKRWLMVRVGWRSQYCGLFSMKYDGLTLYLIDNEFYFGDDRIYISYDFDLERYAFFQRAILQLLSTGTEFMPDVLHAHDWQTSMLPYLLRYHYKKHNYLNNLRIMLTIHNLKYQGICDSNKLRDLYDLGSEESPSLYCQGDGAGNMMKCGIILADKLTTVSPQYASEIHNSFYGEGLQEVIRQNSYKLHGILNGIDTDVYKPATDDLLPKKYSSVTYKKGKQAAKQALTKILELQDTDRPLAVMVSRLVAQKGLDLMNFILPEMLEQNINIAVIGTGDEKYENVFKRLAAQHDNFAFYNAYDPDLARLFYAAADLYLMPSIFEPCGLSQMIAMRYGALPIVRQTGGLYDSVVPYGDPGKANGFGFYNINAHELLFALKRALHVYYTDTQKWHDMVLNAMRADFSWKKSARVYSDLYNEFFQN